MHCPNCGVAVENESITYCRGCGQQLNGIRAAMAGTAVEVRGVEVSHAGLNLGVGLMLGGVLPALLAVIYSPIAIPAALLMMVIALIAIFLGSGPLLRMFQQGEIPKEIERARRREIMFGSTLMFFATIIATMIATMIVAVTVPDSWVPTGLVVSIAAAFVLLLASSKMLYQGYRDLGTGSPVEIDPPAEHAPTTRELETVVLELPPTDAKTFADVFTPSSVTEGTTRQLELESERK